MAAILDEDKMNSAANNRHNNSIYQPNEYLKRAYFNLSLFNANL